MDNALVWFRKDLRVHDHEPLFQAAGSGQPVVGVYIFDTRLFNGKTSFGSPKTGVHRAKFIIDSVKILRENLENLGTTLIVRVGLPEVILPELARELNAHSIYYHYELGSEEHAVEELVRSHCESVNFYRYIGHNVVHPEELPFNINELPSVFTAFRKKVEKTLYVRPLLPTPKTLVSPIINEKGEIPNEQGLGYLTPGNPAYQGGSTQGRERLKHFFFESDAIQSYKETRNGMLKKNDSSKLSPYLALGCLSPRYVYWKLKEYEKERGSNESTYWLFFELMWRDYFWLVHAKYGDRIFYKGGLFGLPYSWKTDHALIQSWVNSQTGYPLVDANMKEMKETGWMSNRGRQNVASFLTKNLGIDWRVGAEWFESCLIDYDVSSNYGNWCYMAGVGNDVRSPYRVFNVAKQGKDYDPEGTYVTHWLPELKQLPSKKIYEVHTLTEEEQDSYHFHLGKDYPTPIVDLKLSAQQFKDQYHRARGKDAEKT